MVFATHELTQTARLREGAIEAVSTPVFATAPVVTTARLLERSKTKSSHPVHIHMIENAGSGDDTGDVSDAAFCAQGFTLSDIRQLLDVRQGAKSANNASY
ncbi:MULTISPECIES: hypothetical protein [Mesorhizobium]|uniref:Uncharacterized protein n=1 Tax=Mesorhizobium erdmanii TaxID=1777866 RepID=A0A6M7UTK3_9HYPH|nr:MULTISPECIES: hypothetical protein [Mesorhizobium]QKC79270.1 hypothetical protein EB233_30605 [Mesorhizobium erdmanii]